MKYLLASLLIALSANVASAVSLEKNPLSIVDAEWHANMPASDAHIPRPTCTNCAATVHWQYVTETPLTDL